MALFLQSSSAVKTDADYATKYKTLAAAFGSNNLAGSLLIAIGDHDNSSAISGVSDTAGNTWAVVLSQAFNFATHTLDVWYAPNAKAGANTVTATWAPNFGSVTLIVAEYAGPLETSPFDRKANAASGNVDVAGPADSGNTTATANPLTLLVAALGVTATADPTAGTGYTLRATQANTQSGMNIGLEDRIVQATGTYNAQFNYAGNHQWGCGVAAFKDFVLAEIERTHRGAFRGIRRP